MPVVRLSAINCSYGENARRRAIPAAATFNGSEGNHSWKADIDVKIVSTAKDAREGDHIFTILRDMKGAGGEGDFGGLNITLGGGEMLTFLEMHDMLRGALGENASSASDTFTLGTRKVSHEIGHTLGLRHPFNLIPGREDAKWFPNDNKQLYPDGGFWVGRGLDDGNPISSLGAKNIMRYHPPGGKISKDSPVGMQLESSQVRLMQHYYDQGMLNGQLYKNPSNFTSDGKSFRAWDFFNRKQMGGSFK